MPVCLIVLVRYVVTAICFDSFFKVVQTLIYTNQTADQLYLDFKIYHSFSGVSQNCICIVSASSSKVASPRCHKYKRIKYDIKWCKYNIGIRTNVFKCELCIGVDQENLGQSDSEEVRDWFNFPVYSEFQRPV